ncbi:hypothetical protein ABVF61_15190 [Roseibium sp. HPY-6]|uniref:hypothetical protein n=1 Tax=Roseibium sp. HPY-6 TaxID=3229852 RepID=UPI0033902F78
MGCPKSLNSLTILSVVILDAAERRSRIRKVWGLFDDLESTGPPIPAHALPGRDDDGGLASDHLISDAAKSSLGFQGGEAGGAVTSGNRVHRIHLFQSKLLSIVIPDEAQRRSGTGEPRSLFHDHVRTGSPVPARALLGRDDDGE